MPKQGKREITVTIRVAHTSVEPEKIAEAMFAAAEDRQPRGYSTERRGWVVKDVK